MAPAALSSTQTAQNTAKGTSIRSKGGWLRPGPLFPCLRATACPAFHMGGCSNENMGEGRLLLSQPQENHPIPSPGKDHCYLGVRTNGLAAFHTGVGTELVKALQTSVVAFLLHTLLPLLGVPTVVANFSIVPTLYPEGPHTGCMDNGMCSARAVHSCQQLPTCCLRTLSSAAVPAAATTLHRGTA